MENLLPVLKKSKLFCALPEEVLRQSVLSQGTLRTFPKQTIILSPQEQLNWFGIIVEGKVHISQIFANGTNSLMGTLRPTFILGIDLICTQSRRSPYYAIAAKDTRILTFPAELVLQPGLLPDAHWLDVCRRLMTLLSHENIRKHYRLAILSQRGLRNRILTYLVMQSERQNTNSFWVPFSREELADFLCVNRSALSHELSLMEQEGLIRFHKNQFILLKPGRMESPWTIEG